MNRLQRAAKACLLVVRGNDEGNHGSPEMGQRIVARGHKALIASGIEAVIIASGVLFMMRRIQRELVGAAHRDAWETPLGKPTGCL